MSIRIARLVAATSMAMLAFAPGCSKSEDGAKASASAPGGDETSTTPPAPDPAPEEADTKGETPKDEHDQRVENAKKAIPTIAADGTTNAAVKAPDVADAKTIAQDKAAIRAAVPSTNAQPAAGGVTKVAETPTYVVSVDAPAGSAGKDGSLKVIVKPKKGWKLNLEFPTRLTVEPPAGVSVAKKSQKKADAVEFSEKKGATWSVSYKPSAAGKKQFSGELRFAVCTDATCDPKRATLAFAVDVK